MQTHNRGHWKRPLHPHCHTRFTCAVTHEFSTKNMNILVLQWAKCKNAADQRPCQQNTKTRDVKHVTGHHCELPLSVSTCFLGTGHSRLFRCSIVMLSVHITLITAILIFSRLSCQPLNHCWSVSGQDLSARTLVFSLFPWFLVVFTAHKSRLEHLASKKESKLNDKPIKINDAETSLYCTVSLYKEGVVLQKLSKLERRVIYLAVSLLGQEDGEKVICCPTHGAAPTAACTPWNN